MFIIRKGRRKERNEKGKEKKDKWLKLRWHVRQREWLWLRRAAVKDMEGRST